MDSEARDILSVIKIYQKLQFLLQCFEKMKGLLEDSYRSSESHIIRLSNMSVRFLVMNLTPNISEVLLPGFQFSPNVETHAYSCKMASLIFVQFKAFFLEKKKKTFVKA